MEFDRLPVKVLGCLGKEEITILLFPGNGLVDGGIIGTLPAEMIPLDLRIPNSEFDVLCDRLSGEFVKVLRKADSI